MMFRSDTNLHREFDRQAVAAGYTDTWLIEEDNLCRDLIGEKYGHLQCLILSSKAGMAQEIEPIKGLGDAINPLVVKGITKHQIGEFETLQGPISWFAREILLGRSWDRLGYDRNDDITIPFTSEADGWSVDDWEDFTDTPVDDPKFRTWNKVEINPDDGDPPIDVKVKCRLDLGPGETPGPRSESTHVEICWISEIVL